MKRLFARTGIFPRNNVRLYSNKHQLRGQEEARLRSLRDPTRFWGEAAKALTWDKPFDNVLSDSKTAVPHRWFTGGKINACYNAIDVHLPTRKNQNALIYDSPVTSTQKKFTYEQLHKEVARFASVLQSQGVQPGDRVLIYMPMIPEAVIAVLACSRIGAVHTVVFGGFAADQVATRLIHSQSKLILTASCGLEGKKVIPYLPIIREALTMSTHHPSAVIVHQRPQLEVQLSSNNPWLELDWTEQVSSTNQLAPCVPMPSNAPLYILYTSGTTGQPKGVVRDTAGYVVALKWALPHIYNVAPSDVWWASSDIGWVVGISFIIYAPLLLGATSIMYEGKPVGTPDAGAFWRVISEHKVNSVFTAPTAARVIKKEDPQGKLAQKYDLSSLKSFWLAGERADLDSMSWVKKVVGDKCTVTDHWWQTETGWPITSVCYGLGESLAQKGFVGKPVPGYDVRVVDSNSKELPRFPANGDLMDESLVEKSLGDIVVKTPLPPGCLVTLHRDEEKAREAYFSQHSGFYHTGDSGLIDENGYVAIMARTDDIINTAGHRLSTGALEEALSSLVEVAECAVIGVKCDIKGEVPVGFLVLKGNCQISEEELKKKAVEVVRQKIGPVAAFKKAVIVERLPKTRSGKVLRSTMKKIANKMTYSVPAAIDDPQILSELEDALN
eukprot:TRINITY_DN3666_c0_g1_i1.p1 TRINITY_DN3666_c0_g1~~TRINITY_DN3666_c0_g1_i1.p1  ORF type:complete len:669 (-),score=113.22 TRINITY_DN3666_c0_g1_i1:17-2023(-)